MYYRIISLIQWNGERRNVVKKVARLQQIDQLKFYLLKQNSFESIRIKNDHIDIIVYSNIYNNRLEF